MIGPTGTIIREMRTAGIASGRVHGQELADNDLRGPSGFQRAVRLILQPGPEVLTKAPFQVVRYVYRAYGATPEDASQLHYEIITLLHDAGPRYGPNGLPIYQTLCRNSLGAEVDPDTHQPYEEGILEVYAGTDVVAAS